MGRGPGRTPRASTSTVERLPLDTAPLLDLHGSAAGALPTRGVLALRTAIQALMRAGATDDEVRRAMALFCAEARRRGVRAELVLVVLKDVWRTLPEVRRLSRVGREAALARLTTLAIRTFYEPASSAVSPEAWDESPGGR